MWSNTNITDIWANSTIMNTMTGGWGGYSIGTADIGANSVRIWGEYGLDYDNFTYRGIGKNKESIEVDGGSPAKAKYAIFYAVKKDPVIFCKNRRQLYKEVKKLLKRSEVDIKSIRIFQLIGGAKKIAKRNVHYVHH